MREVNFELNGQKRTVMIRVSSSLHSVVVSVSTVSGRERHHPVHQENQGRPQQTCPRKLFPHLLLRIHCLASDWSPDEGRGCGGEGGARGDGGSWPGCRRHLRHEDGDGRPEQRQWSRQSHPYQCRRQDRRGGSFGGD